MSTVSVLIVDDEEDARELIKVHLKRHLDLSLVGEARNGKEAVSLIEAKNPQIVLLDIQMPEMSGIEVLQQIDHPPVLIFVTAYDEFAVKAFELNALDYLLKPFTKDRFDQTIEKAKSQLQSQQPSQYQDLIDNVINSLDKKATHLQRLVHRTGTKQEYIRLEDVVLITASDQYAEVYTANRKYVLRISLDYLEETLDPTRFFRAHRSHIIQINYVLSIEQYEPRNYLIHLDGGYKAKLSRDKKDVLNEKLLSQ